MAQKHVPGKAQEPSNNEAVYQLASIVESSGDAIISKTLQGIVTTWNSSAEKLYGYTAGEMIGKSISIIIPPGRQKELPGITERIMAGEACNLRETTRMRKDGTYVEVSITFSPIRDVQGRIVGTSTITHDITEQKRMAQELAIHSRELEHINSELSRQRDELTILNLALEEANRARSQFHSTMSHELRTPLASIIGFSQVILDNAEKASLSRRQQNSLERILKNGKHLLVLISDMLDLAKIEAGRMAANYVQVDVDELLNSVVAETQPLALARNLALSAEVEERAVLLESDPVKLRLVLLNLVSNALKFTETGQVTVSARRVLSPATGIHSIALAVQDTGIGIPADAQERIFEIFYQADGSYTRRFGGTGLGLSIVSRLAALLGGTIEVKSALGQGSIFTVLLPISAVHQSVEHDPPLLYPAQQAAPTISNRETQQV